jgi:hypothetical protein
MSPLIRLLAKVHSEIYAHVFGNPNCRVSFDQRTQALGVVFQPAKHPNYFAIMLAYRQLYFETALPFTRLTSRFWYEELATEARLKRRRET